MPEPKIESEIMRISWGPQHPMSGQTRILLDTDGEKVHKIIADIGFTHRGI
jgi:NADH:ubiquinone oxidoreductase subunit D